MWKKRVFGSRAARVSAQTVVAAPISPSLPVAHTLSGENSRASSAAVTELAQGLDFIFDQLDYEEEPGDLLQLHLERLIDEAATYHNSRIDPEVGEEWSITHDVAQLLYAACRCSSWVYEPKASQHRSGIQLTPILHRTPSMTGSVKATSIWKINEAVGADWPGKSLVVSIRGTASAADHIVNMNGEAKDASTLFKFDEPIHAHAGFLGCATMLLPTLLAEVTRQVGLDKKIAHIIFTGHSAGGAVSALAFLHFVQHTPSELSGVKFSLITFGSAPSITSSTITSTIQSQANVELMLAIINEYDMVARTDGPYLRSVVDLYRSRYALPPSGAVTPSVMSLAAHANLGLRGAWPLPPPAYHLVGDIVVLRKVVDIPPASRDDGDSDTSTLVAPSLKAMKLPAEEFEKLVFCDIAVHRRRVYLERLGILAGESLSGEGSLSAPSRTGTMERVIAEVVTNM